MSARPGGAPELLADRHRRRAGQDRRGMTNNDDILTVTGLNVAYGESKALFDVSMSVRASQVVACVGRNGAGKSTLLKSITGFLKPTSGSIVSNGTSLVGLAAFVIAGKGIKYIPQDKKVFSDLTVRENLELGSYASQDYDWAPVFDYFPKLKVLMDRKAGYLSGGERQMLMVGRAILGQPKLLLVDEQNLPLVCAIADKVYALKEGRIMAELTDLASIKPEACEKYL